MKNNLKKRFRNSGFFVRRGMSDPKWFALFIICYLILQTFSPLSAQEIKCNYCGKAISTEYLQVEDKYFHPNHFLCSLCGKPIDGEFSKDSGKYYHTDCSAKLKGLICAFCGEIISGEYYVSDNKKYHSKCYYNDVAPKCEICKQPLVGTYLVDFFGHRYHESHKSELSECNNCGRLICEPLTGGGVILEDKREICNICYSTRLENRNEYENLANLVLSRLETIGFRLRNKDIKIFPVNRDNLRTISEGSYSSAMRGFTVSNVLTTYTNDKLEGVEKSHKIYLLDRLPLLDTESILAHELMHVWVTENTDIVHSPELLEGSCNFVSYLYLKMKRSSESEFIIKQMEMNPDPVYGSGYRKVKDRFEFEPLSVLFTFLKSNRSL